MTRDVEVNGTYVGHVWSQLRDHTAILRLQSGGKVLAQFDRRELGYWAYRWHQFEAFEFDFVVPPVSAVLSSYLAQVASAEIQMAEMTAAIVEHYRGLGMEVTHVGDSIMVEEEKP